MDLLMRAAKSFADMSIWPGNLAETICKHLER